MSPETDARLVFCGKRKIQESSIREVKNSRMVQCGTRARSLVLRECLASWLLEFFLMVRRKVSGNSRTLGFMREAQNSGVKYPRSQEFKNGPMRNSGEILGSS